MGLKFEVKIVLNGKSLESIWTNFGDASTALNFIEID
jgi:hypothetical protein